MIKPRTMMLAAALVAATALAGGAAAQTGSPTLEGEDLLASPATFTASANCDTTHDSTVSWSATGVASGPYPGTFTLHGTLAVGPQTLPGRPPGPNREGTFAGPVTSFTETFTITSGTTTITGTKTLDPQASTGTVGTCQQVSQFPILDFLDGQGTVVEVNTQTRYEASIQSLDGTTTDSGIAYASLAEIDITGSCPAGPSCEGRLAGFDQTFALSDQASCANDDNDRQDDDDNDCEDEG
jgi:hypothetical protein